MKVLRDRLRGRRVLVGIAVGLTVAVAATGVALTRDDPGTMIADGHFTAAPTVLSIIASDVQITTGPGVPSRSGQREEALSSGTTVEARIPNGRAVLTFRDGSTTELEPGSSVRIEEHSTGKNGELIVRLRQDRGRTWSYVQPQLSPNSRFHLTTPAATVVVRGTKLEVDVAETAPGGASLTTVSVFEGRADLVAQGTVVPVPAGHTTEIVNGNAPSAARRLAPEGVCMRIEVSSSALITVTDPHGRSAGQTPKGTLTQIPGTIVTGPQDDPQAIDVFAPAAGSWEIGIVPRDDGGPLQLLAYTVVDGQVAHRRALTMTIDRFKRVVTSLRLDADGRSGSFTSPVESDATRAVALPSDNTTTAPPPQARLFEPQDDALALACVPAEQLQRRDSVQPVPSPGQTTGR